MWSWHTSRASRPVCCASECGAGVLAARHALRICEGDPRGCADRSVGHLWRRRRTSCECQGAGIGASAGVRAARRAESKHKTKKNRHVRMSSLLMFEYAVRTTTEAKKGEGGGSVRTGCTTAATRASASSRLVRAPRPCGNLRVRLRGWNPGTSFLGGKKKHE